ncbi:unnamed protein product [Eruca vesicaria subsp. sativa]|uniref:Uncharacterized protein n=1 Tax=Eruca vesicaria subsp. sativa TaxID=29727 RepID=A0ABC8JR07_ERUVS|nr:unnamed protein product [Eruca vesicaria subsp. sativa]
MEVEDPEAEKILEEKDWAEEEEEGNYGDDDLMDEDDLLLEEEEDTLESEATKSKEPRTSETPSWWKGSPETESPHALRGLEAEKKGGKGRLIRTPPTRARTSTSRKKGTPSPIAAGLSLKKRNLLLGRASPRAAASTKTTNGLSPGLASSLDRTSVPGLEKPTKEASKNQIKATKAFMKSLT